MKMNQKDKRKQEELNRNQQKMLLPSVKVDALDLV